MLEGFDDTLRVIEITFVRSPYFLDFGKATTDDRRKEYRDPQFLAKAIHSWQQDFGAKWKEVAAVIHYLKDKHEILYLDPRRGNVNFGDADDDDDWLAEPGIDYSEYE